MDSIERKEFVKRINAANIVIAKEVEESHSSGIMFDLEGEDGSNDVLFYGTVAGRGTGFFDINAPDPPTPKKAAAPRPEAAPGGEPEEVGDVAE